MNFFLSDNIFSLIPTIVRAFCYISITCDPILGHDHMLRTIGLKKGLKAGKMLRVQFVFTYFSFKFVFFSKRLYCVKKSIKLRKTSNVLLQINCSFKILQIAKVQ